MNKEDILIKLEGLLLEKIQKAEEVYQSSYEYTTKGMLSLTVSTIHGVQKQAISPVPKKKGWKS